MKPRIRLIAFAVLAAIGVMAGVGVWLWPQTQDLSVDYKMPGNPQPKIDAAKAAAIQRRERVIDQTIWRKEMEAQEHGRVFEDFWDALNAATNKWDVVEGFRFAEILMGQGRVKESLPHEIERWTARAREREAGKKPDSPPVDSYQSWIETLRQWKASGWEIMQCEFRHNAFDPQTNQIPARSKFFFSVHLTNAAPARAVVEGDLLVEWDRRETNSAPKVRRIDGDALEVMIRPGPPAFREILTETFDPPDLTKTIEPLLVYDLDGDGVAEIALPSVNRLYRKRGATHEAGKFCSTARLGILNGVFADMDGDGAADLLYATFDGIFLLKGTVRGEFQTAPRALMAKQEKFHGRPAITCGDIDADGDLDVFVGQYKAPFVGGSMPTPYYDANDGYPSYLYLNEGAGNLRDATMGAGLGPKRLRRVYSASFVDVNADGALDLVVTSDFAGVDVYRNHGNGKFTDVTNLLLDQSHLFGMGHTFGDFNNDGRLDFYVTGMTSATAERLERLGLERVNSNFDPSMRVKMSFGSRMYLADAADESAADEIKTSFRRFLQGADGAARTGWSWGVAAADFDNDGWVDLYVGNGMESMRSVRDYEGELWLHDMFVGTSPQRAGPEVYFASKGNSRRRASESFGGFDKNRLLLNRAGKKFVNVAHLLGVALEDDCRNLVAADFDGDGRVDLAFTTTQTLPTHKEKLQVFRNAIQDQGTWIGFSFREEPGHRSPIGAQVSLSGPGVQKVGAIVTGDSFRSQHPLTLHFGLGEEKRVEAVEIRWPGGAVTRLAGPQMIKTHAVRASKQ